MAFSFFYEAFDAFTQLKDDRAMAALKYMILMRILAGKVEFQKEGLFLEARNAGYFWQSHGGGSLERGNRGFEADFGRVFEQRFEQSDAHSSRNIHYFCHGDLTSIPVVLRGRGSPFPHRLSAERADGAELFEDRGAVRRGGNRVRGAEDGFAAGGSGSDRGLGCRLCGNCRR